MQSEPVAKAPTIQDIAHEVGVTKMTVSLALSGKGRISAATRDEILRVAQELRYEPNRQAQRLSNGQRSLIALFSPRWFPGTVGQKIELIQGLLNERGYDVPVYGHGFRHSESADTQIDLAKRLCRERPRAIICQNSVLPAAAIKELARYQQEGGVVVSYGRELALECDQVLFDYVDSGYRATRHLLEMGHRRLGLYEPGGNERTRLLGFERAMREFGLPIREDWILNGSPHEEGGAHLARIFLESSDRPTGLVVVNDASAATFVHEVMRAGLRVPQDVSVVGQDDTSSARYCYVPLTTVAQPVAEIAAQVADLLCARLEGGGQGAARQIHLYGKLMLRRSTAAPENQSAQSFGDFSDRLISAS